jgi:hypothetical protein
MNSPGRREAMRVRPTDDTLDAAVARMTVWANEQGHSRLVMSSQEWQALVLRHLLKGNVGPYIQELYSRSSELATIEEAQQLADLAINIWNNTPQPDRGGKSAYELAKVGRRARRPHTKT